MINRNSKIRKGPLVFTTALLFGLPICMAQLAISDVSYAKPVSLPQSQRTQKQSLEAFQRPASNFLGQSPQKILSSETPVSLSDIEQLQSSLTRAESQVSQLLISPAKNPALQETINTKISNLKERISNLKSAIAKAKADYAAYQKAAVTLSKALETLNSATSNKEAALAAYNLAAQQQTEAQANKESAIAARDKAAQELQTASDELALKQASTNTKLNILNAAALNKALKAQAFAEKATLLQDANVVLANAQTQYNIALEAKNSASASRDLAQSNYDNNLTPDPTWTQPTYQQEHVRQIPHTRQVATTTLVPHTTYTTTGGITAEVFNRQGYNQAPPLPSANETPVSTQNVSNIDFQWGGGQVLNSGYSEDVIVKFTGNLLFPTDGYYQFYTPADDGTKLTIAGMNLINDWVDKGGGGSTSQQVFIRGGVLYPFTLYYYENGGGAAVSFQYYSLATPYWQVVPSSYLGTSTQATTTYTEETTYTTETYYTEEIYYTTELVTSVEKTIQVDIGEGGQATFTAPEGATFTYSNLRYESYSDPTCGANVSVQVDGLQNVTLYADNGVFGDPCGGQVKHLVGTLTYKGVPTAPLIKDPALKTILDNAEEVFQTKSDNFALAEESLNVASNMHIATSSDYDTANSQLTTATTDLDVAQSEYDFSTTELATATTVKTEVETQKVAADDNFVLAETAATQVESTVVETTTQLQTAEAASLSATNTFTEAEVAHTEAVTSYESSVLTAKTTSTQLPTSNEIEEVSTLIEEPVPTPPVEEGSKEIPAVLTAENLMEVNLEAVDPTELTVAQAEQLKEAALETFLTAEEGSAEYEQALDALYLAAEQDDIELSPELAAIPGLAAAAELVNFLGNAGADMSPKTREESKKVVVTAVVAVGAAVASATGAATSAASSSSSSSSGSGSSRRKQ